jgi:hypothetical protein
MTRTTIAIAVLGACLAAAGRARATGPVDIEAIERAIDEAGASWVAGPTPQSAMSAEELHRLVPPAAPMPEPALADAGPAWDGPPPPPPPTPSVDLARFSWHDYEDEDWMTDVKDQGTCGGCWAFASLAATEGCYNVAIGNPNLDIDLSEQVVIACTDGGCSGGMPEPVAQYLLRTGVPDEQCYPYLMIDGRCDDRCADWADRAFKIARWGWVSTIFGGDGAVKDRLVKGPLYASMTVYADFMAYREGVYEHVWGEDLGGHSVTLVGWDDANDSWICKNSWSTAWGDDGYFEIRRGDSDIGFHMIWVEVDASRLPGHPCLEPRRQSIEAVSGGPPVSVEVTLTNCGGATLDWTAEPDPSTGWLSVAPASGSSPVGEGTVLTATVDPATLTRLGAWGGSVLVKGGISDARSYLDIEVIAVAPEAGFEADPLTGPAPLEVAFTNTSTGSAVQSSWDFGDGGTSTSRHPVHTYAAEGVYSVTLEVDGPEGGDSATREGYITVLPPGEEPVPDADMDASADATDEDGPGQGASPGCGCAIVG